MARPRKKGSTNSFNGIGMDKEDDKKLIAILKDKGLSFKSVARTLFKAYIKENS